MTAPVSDHAIVAEWQQFAFCLREALRMAREEQPHGAHLEEWQEQLMVELGGPAVAQELAELWGSIGVGVRLSPDQRAIPAAQLLRLELQAVTRVLGKATGVPVHFPPAPTSVPWERPPITTIRPKPGPLKKIWRKLTRPIDLKEALKAGGTLMNSIKDLLENAPAWLKALLTIGGEAVDTVTGD